MASIVAELRNECLKSGASITDILRKALVIASQRQDSAFVQWINNE